MCEYSSNKIDMFKIEIRGCKPSDFNENFSKKY